MEIETALRRIILKNARVPVAALDEGAALAPQVGFDSLALVMTLAELEDTLEITFPVERVDDPADLTFRDLLGLVLQEVGGAATES